MELLVSVQAAPPIAMEEAGVIVRITWLASLGEITVSHGMRIKRCVELIFFVVILLNYPI